jgi:8-oxo-dGTP diphosphatase
MKKQGVMVLLKRDDKWLFLIRHKENDLVHKQGVYLPIGGKVEENEYLEDAAIREVKEESGVKVNSVILKGVLYNTELINKNIGDWDSFLFISEDFEGEPIEGNEGSFEWVRENELDNLKTYEGVKKFILSCIKNKFIIMESKHENTDLVDDRILYNA